MKRLRRKNPPPPEPALPEEEVSMTFLEHLEEFRLMLWHSILALVIGMCIALPFAPQILQLLTLPLGGVVEEPAQFLRSLRVAGAFTLAMRIAAWGGLLISAPFLVYFVARFIFPGLHRHERDLARRSGILAVGLFVLGTVVGYLYCLPLSLRMMLRIHDWLAISAEWMVNDYVAFCIQILLGFGLAFELPVVVLILGKLGFVTVRQLRAKRPHAFIGCLCIGMILTPQDIASMLIMSVPLYILYELCIVIMAVSPAFAEAREEDPLA